MAASDDVLRGLTELFVDGPWDEEILVARAARMLDGQGRWLRPLIRRVLSVLPADQRPNRSEVDQILRADDHFRTALRKHRPKILQLSVGTPAMCPIPAAREWSVRPLRSTSEVADWLSLDDGELHWFADPRQWERKVSAERLRHYRYRFPRKPDGTVRVIESPKPRLRAIQRRIHSEIFAGIPLHEAAHGFRSGRSILTFTEPHRNRRAVARLDLANFFPTLTAPRVRGIFRAAGYPEPVTTILTGLCVNSVPEQIWQQVVSSESLSETHNLWPLYRQPHLPQGAPTSPILANLCAYRLDCRLTGLARSADVCYTRYADDLAFSGDGEFSRTVGRFLTQAAAITMTEGFRVNHRKTRIMRSGSRQHLAGLIVNGRPNVPREQFDRLKAILTNCVRHGPETQNCDGHPRFREHLAGRISFVAMIHPDRGRKLSELWKKIVWPEDSFRNDPESTEEQDIP